MTLRSRQSWVPSPLRMLGIHQRKSVRRIGMTKSDGNQSEDAQTGIMIENHDVFVLWRLLGRGFHWRQQYPYGSIIPSLATFPVVNDIWAHYDCTLKDPRDSLGVIGIHQAFSSGMIHPFTRDTHGISLFHVSKHCVT
jgi:hypothetical protein